MGTISQDWPEWDVCQRHACIFVQAPTHEAAGATGTRRIGPIGGRAVARDVGHEVFTREKYPEQARPGDYTRSVIIAS